MNGNVVEALKNRIIKRQNDYKYVGSNVERGTFNSDSDHGRFSAKTLYGDSVFNSLAPPRSVTPINV